MPGEPPVTSATLWAFCVAAVVVQLSPGPGMLFILSSSAVSGRLGGAAAALGAATGMLIQTVAAVAGLAALFRVLPELLNVLRVVGAVYLVYLAVMHVRAARLTASRAKVATAVPLRQTYVPSLINNLANPKAVLFYAALLPAFVHASAVPTEVQLAVLGSIFLLIGPGIDVAIGTVAGVSCGRVLQRPRARAAMDYICGAVYAALAARLLSSNVRPV